MFWIFANGLIIFYVTDNFTLINDNNFMNNHREIQKLFDYKARVSETKSSIIHHEEVQTEKLIFETEPLQINKKEKNLNEIQITRKTVLTDYENFHQTFKNIEEMLPQVAEKAVQIDVKKSFEFLEDPVENLNPLEWPGERGKAVKIPSSMAELAKKRFIENQFNIVASELISINRSILDLRNQAYVYITKMLQRLL